MATMPMACRGFVATLVVLGLGCSDLPSGGTPAGTGNASGAAGAAGALGGGAGSSSGAAAGSASGGIAGSGAVSGGAGSAAGGSGSASAGGGSAAGGASAGGSGGSGAGCGCAPRVGSCNVFPSDDHWNRDVSSAAVDRTWTDRVHELVGDVNIHPDYGVDGSTLYGIPINVVPATQPAVPIFFDWYEDESDPGPYPFPSPSQIAIEGQSPMECDGDCHVLVVQEGTCTLYEGYACEHREGAWRCGNGAKWDLTRASYGQRPEGWTSADAAGLPIMPGLVRYAEVRAGAIHHALRFTVPCTRPAYVAPGTHYAVPPGCNDDDPNAPPMGIRMRLRSNFDDSAFPPSARVVTTAMKRYGMILADNGSSFYFQGDANPGWTEGDIEPLKRIPASAFEAVEVPALEP
jgi:hypothetical protein